MAYSFKQRKDGGFDFFDASGKKTNIESYTKNTGANINQLRQKLATQGDTQSQRIVAGLPTQFRAPTQQQSTPSVFNTPIVRTPTMSQTVSQPTIQAPKVYTPKAQQAYVDAKIIGTGSPNEVKQAITRTVDRKNSVKLDPQFKQGKSYEDIARDAGFSIDEVKRYAERNHKGYGDLGLIGNAARATGQFVGTTVDNGVGIVRKPISTLALIDSNNQQKINDDLSQINKDLYYRNITPKAAQERASALTKDLIGMKATQDQKTGMYRLGDMNTAEFTGQFAQQGIDSASLLPVAGGAASGSARIASALGNKTAANTLNKAASVMTAGAQTQATSKLANALTARGMNPQTANLIGNAVTSNAKQSLVYGTAQTSADVASGRGITPESLAMNYGADFLMGAVPEIGLGSVGRGINMNNAKVHQELIRTNPTYKANTDKLTGIDATIARAQANGDVRALEGLQAVRVQLSDSNALIARRYAEQGFLGGKNATGFKDAEARGEVFEGVDGLPRFEVDDSGARLTGKMPEAPHIPSKLGEIIDHPELFKQYPELRGVKVRTNNDYDSGNAHYDHRDNSITVAPDAKISTILHEAQHAIQEKEGFAKGGNLSTGSNAKHDALIQQIEMLDNETLQLVKAGKENTPEFKRKKAQLDTLFAQEKEVAKGKTAFEQYQSLAGEAEARAVEARMDMPMSERYVKPDVSKAPKEIQGKTLYRGINEKEWQALQRGETSRSVNRPDEAFVGSDRELAEMAAEAQARRGRNAYIVEYKPGTENKVTRGGSLGHIQNPNNIIEGEYLGKKLGMDDIARVTDADGKVVYEAPTTNRSTFYDSLDVPKKDLIVRNSTDQANYITKGRTPSKIHPEDQTVMAKLIDYARGYGKELSDKAAHELQIDAARIAERYGIEVKWTESRKPLSSLADAFDRRLSGQKYEGVAMSIDEGKIDPTAALKAEALKYKSADEFLQAKADEGGKLSDTLEPFGNRTLEQAKLEDLHYGINLGDVNGDIPKTIKEYTDLYNQAHTPQPKPEVAQPKVEAPKQPTPFEQDLKKAGLGVEPDAYRKQPQDVKKAIDTYISNENPQLAYALDSKLHFPDGIPKVRPEDVKRITGLTPREAGIPPIYVSRNATPIDKLAVEYEITVRGNTSGELKMTSEDFLDTMMDAIEANRSVGQQTKLIRELRNNPDVIAKAKATLEAERAQYGAPEVVEPSKSDIKAYEKMVTQQADKTLGKAAPAQPQSQVSRTIQSQPAASAKQNGVARLSKRDLQAKAQGQESASVQLQNQGPQTARTYTDNTTDVVKKRGFTKSVKASDEVSAETRRKVNGKYNVRSTEKLALSANDFATGNLKKISEDVHARLDTKLGSIGDQDIADAIAVAKRLDFKRDFTGSQAIYDKLAEHGTKGGQTIQAFSLLRNRTPEGVKYQMLKNLKKAGVKLTDIEQKEVGKLIDNVRKTKVGTDARDRALFDTLDYVSRRIPSTNADKLVNFWRAGLLTAPKTTGGNILGNATELATQKLWTNPVAIGTDKFFSMFTGKRTKTLASGGIKGAKEGLNRGVDYLKTGYDPRDMPNAKYDAPRRINYKNKILDTYVNGVYRWMGAQDQPFYYAAKSAAAYDLAKADGMNLKYKGQQLADYVEKSVADAEWKPQTFKTAKDVTDYAKYAVYQNETLLGSLASGMKQGASRFGNGKGKALVDFVLPFTQVPSSVAMRIIDRTPIGTAREVIKQIRAKSFDQRAMAEAVGNGSFGIPVIAAGYALAASGELTGQYPTDNAEKKLWEAQGKQPYSVKIGDRWYSLNYMQPFGTLMAVGKQVHDDKADGKSDGEAWMNATGSAAKSIESQSFLKGLNGVLSAVNDPNRSMAQYARSTASSVVPNFIRSGAAATDSKQRDMETPFDAFKGAVPGARQTLPVRQDMFGAELESKDNPINMYANPLNPSKVRNKNDVTTNELDRLHKTDNSIVPTEFTKASIGGVTLTSAQVRNLNELVNTEVKSEWDRAIQADNYKSLTDEEKATYLKKIKDAVGNNVKKQFVADNMLASTTTYKSSAVPGSPSASGASTAVSAKTPTSAKSIIETYDTLDTEARKKWNTEKNTNAAVTKSLQAWLGDKVKIPEVTNDVAKEWADFQNDYADGKISKLKENDQKKAILKKAFNSQLSTDEKEIHTLTKTELQYYYDNGVITDENINKAIAVEKQLFDAGLIAKETLQRNLGSSARGYKTSSGSSGRKTSTKTASKASIAELLASQKQINDINNSTYLSLSKLLGSVTSGSSKMAKNKIGREVTLKKITGAKA